MNDFARRPFPPSPSAVAAALRNAFELLVDGREATTALARLARIELTIGWVRPVAILALVPGLWATWGAPAGMAAAIILVLSEVANKLAARAVLAGTPGADPAMTATNVTISALYAAGGVALVLSGLPHAHAAGVAILAGGALYIVVFGHADRRLLAAMLAPQMAGLAIAAIAAGFAEGGWIVMAPLATVLGIVAAAALVLHATHERLRLARARLQQELHSLEHRVAQRTGELHEAMRRAEAASIAKSVFLANMSHELRTPLSSIIGYGELLRDDAKTGAADPEDAERVLAAARHLLGLINQVLEFARGGGKDPDPVELAPVNLAELVQAAVEAARPLARVNGNRLVMTLDGALGELPANRARLQQCLAGLIENACKFTRDGLVSVSAERRARAVVLTVSDTGIGMSAEQVAGLFQPFSQGEEGPTRRFGGAGLGLAFARQTAEQLGGRIDVASAPGVGSTMSLTLPFASPAKARSAA